MDSILTSTTKSTQSIPGSYANKELLYTTQIFRTLTIRCSLELYPDQPFYGWGLIPLQEIQSADLKSTASNLYKN